MKQVTFWGVTILMAVGVQLWGRMMPSSKQVKKTSPASVSKIEGTDSKRVTLRPEAARRLDITTAIVREGVVDRTHRFAGEVVNVSPGLGAAIVRVELNEHELRSVQQEEPAFVLPLARDSRPSRIKALPLSGAIANTLSLESKVRRIKALPLKQPTESGLYAVPGTIHYETRGTNHGLVNRQLVFVELTLAGAGEKRKILPYAALLYDAKGNAWVYANPEPLVFIRHPIQIDAIVGDEVLLVDGPPAGTVVVTVGGAELYGAEFGVGK